VIRDDRERIALDEIDRGERRIFGSCGRDNGGRVVDQRGRAKDVCVRAWRRGDVLVDLDVDAFDRGRELAEASATKK